MARGNDTLPWWATGLVLPAANLLLALAVSALVILAIGEAPLGALGSLLSGAFGSARGLGYTLYYATSLMFTGLAAAIAYHAGLFNIGAEGQAYVGGLGVGLVCLGLPGWPWYGVLPLSILAGMLFGASWAALPGFLQAYRGSHVVITTIMFNFLAASLMVYLLVNVLHDPASMSPESLDFSPASALPRAQALYPGFVHTPLNLSFLVALAACLAAWWFIFQTRWGYALRVVGANEPAARYAGIEPKRIIVLAMALSGAAAGLLGVNELQGVQYRIMVNFPAGLGFTGIAVALMGRGNPLGLIPAAILFGGLYQGGVELAFDYPNIQPELVVVIQGVVILFAGALEHLLKAPLRMLINRRRAALREVG